MRAVSKQILGRLEHSGEGRETFLSLEILDQMRKSDAHHLVHQKKSLRSVIEEAKSELAVKKQEPKVEMMHSLGDYMDMDKVNMDTQNSDYMEMF